ncbi:IS1380 family transposase [Kribbella qitaiheensis]|uniref:IS1380 family transposase n=1 Tax=Kribbella qitaiheensis TaxID=1544730 RepID=UPI0036212773
MRVSHGFTAVFDDPNLVSCAGLAPVLSLAERAGLQELVTEHVRIDKTGGNNAHLKIGSLVAGMVCGADSIDDMTLLRHGAMERLFTGVRAPSTLGTFLRSFTFGHIRQLDAVASRLLINLTRHAPLLPGAAELTYIDVDDTVRQTYGYAKQGAGRGYTGVKGLNALLAIMSTPGSAPVIAAARLRKGSTNSVKGAHRLVADALVTAKSSGAIGVRVLRADSAFYNSDVISTCLRHGSCFSITARQDPAVRKAIESIDETAWTSIKYTNAIYDEGAQAWISQAEVAEIGYTAFASRAKAKHVTARLIVRRVPDANPAHQGELFTVYRYHAVFTNSPLPMLTAEKAHRGHAIVEQVIADLKNGPLAHLPSGRFWANSAWLVCAAMAFNLTRAAGTLASAVHAKATTATIRTQLINIPARLARSARRLTLHLPTAWPWEHAWQQLSASTRHGPPRTT